MNGTAIQAPEGDLRTVADQDWRVVAPHAGQPYRLAGAVLSQPGGPDLRVLLFDHPGVSATLRVTGSGRYRSSWSARRSSRAAHRADRTARIRSFLSAPDDQ